MRRIALCATAQFRYGNKPVVRQAANARAKAKSSRSWLTEHLFLVTVPDIPSNQCRAR